MTVRRLNIPSIKLVGKAVQEWQLISSHRALATDPDPLEVAMQAGDILIYRYRADSPSAYTAYWDLNDSFVLYSIAGNRYGGVVQALEDGTLKVPLGDYWLESTAGGEGYWTAYFHLRPVLADVNGILRPGREIVLLASAKISNFHFQLRRIAEDFGANPVAVQKGDIYVALRTVSNNINNISGVEHTSYQIYVGYDYEDGYRYASVTLVTSDGNLTDASDQVLVQAVFRPEALETVEAHY